MISRRRS